MGRLVLVACVMIALFVASDAAATTCGRPGDARSVPPPIGVRAPINTHPKVTLHSGWRTNNLCPAWGIADRNCGAGQFDLELRQAGGPKVLFDAKESRSGDVATIDFIPHAPLAPNARYEVAYAERAGGVPNRIIATFATGTATDTQAPSWSGVTSHTRVGEWPQVAPKPSTGVLSLADLVDVCETQGVVFTGPVPVDDQTPLESIVFAIWMTEESAVIDYASAPTVYARTHFQFGRDMTRLVAIPFGVSLGPSDFAWPTNKRAAKFGLRAVDFAGNVSSPSEVVVRLP